MFNYYLKVSFKNVQKKFIYSVKSTDKGIFLVMEAFILSCYLSQKKHRINYIQKSVFKIFLNNVI